MEQPLGIIVPVYNEGDNISATLTAVEKQVKTPHKIYIVFDFDGDNTLPVARRLREAGLPIEFVRNPQAGVANAIKTGLRVANADFLLVTMADLSDDYSVVDKMCGLMSQGYDIVCGSRYMKGGKQIGGPFFKKLLSRTAGLTLKYLTGMPVRDVTNSFKLYRKTMVDNIEIQSESGFEIGMEIVVKAYFSGYKITELPCTWTDRQAGSSRFRIFKWLPKYLRWYFYALNKTFCKTISPANLKTGLTHSFSAFIKKNIVNIAVLLPVILTIFFVCIFSIKIPFSDEWEFVPLLEKMHNHTLALSDLWSQHNEHRILFPKILMLILARLSNWNIFLELCTSLILATVTLLLLLSLLRNTLQIVPPWLKIFTSLMVFSLAQAVNWSWGWQLQIFLSVLCSVFAIWAANKWQGKTGGLVIVILAAVVSSYSFNTGLLTWPAVLVVMLLQKKWKRRHIIILILACTVAVLLYYYKYSKVEQHPPVLFFVRHPLIYARYVLTFLGSSLSWDSSFSFAIAIIILALISLAIINIWRFDKQKLSTLAPWLALILYACLAACATGVGRAGFGWKQALTSRYTTFSLLLPLSAAVLFCLPDKPYYKMTIGKLFNKRYLKILVVSVFLLLYTSSYLKGIVVMEVFSSKANSSAFCLTNPQAADTPALRKLYPDPDILRMRIKTLSDIGIKFKTPQQKT